LDAITITMLGSSAGAWIATTGILMSLKSKLGDLWGDKTNRIASVVLPVIFVEAAIAATGNAVWYAFLVGLIVGLGASQATNNSQNSYDEKIVAKALKLSAKKEK
jgi:hypothetical protein